MGAIYNAYQPITSAASASPTTFHFPGSGGVVKVRYRVSDSPTTVQETVTLSTLDLDLTREINETIAAGSTRFMLGGNRFVEVAGTLYRDPSPDTGAGTPAGTLDRTTGRARITHWTAGGANAVTVTGLTTILGDAPISQAVWRAPLAPVKPGTLQVRYTEIGGAVKSKSIDATGALEDSDCTIVIDAQTGVIRARFGLWREFASLTAGQLLEPWANPDFIVEVGGVDSVWEPKPVLADTLIYNVVASSTLPPDSQLLGIDAARLPPDGKALVFRTGQLALAHHTASLAPQTLSPSQVIDCGRERLYRVVIEDVDGKRLAAEMFALDRTAGIVTMSPTLDLTGYTGPYTISHSVADLSRIVQTDISGLVTFNKPLTHDYPVGGAALSGVLYVGTLQARIAKLFAQSTWTNVWSDTLIGSAPLAQYNDAQWPIIVTNAGAYPDRLLIKFTNATEFQCIGEKLGLIGIGNINTDFEPINPLTGIAYCKIPYQGWGGGWATGNCLRFNLVGAGYPVDLIRAIQPSAPFAGRDTVELLLIGNVDA